MKKLLFIYNPHSGMQIISRKLHDITDIFTKAGYLVTVRPTQRQGDCIEITKTISSEYDLTVIAGGDGTLNEAVNGFMISQTNKPYGYIPCGSTNDFSHSIGIPLKPTAAAKNAVEGMPFAYDIGRLNERYFTYVAGFGAFTDVTYTTPQETKNTLGYAAYIIEAISSLPTISPYQLSFSSDERQGRGEYVLGLITNTLQVGGMKNILPRDISLDDGVFEVLLVKNPKNALDLSIILSAAMKRDFEASCFEYFKTSHLTLESETPLKWTVDGENGGAHLKSEIVCFNRALSVIANRKN